MNISELNKLGPDQGTVNIQIFVQITSRRESETTSGKPFYDVEVADESGKAKLKFWGDTQAFSFIKEHPGVKNIRLEGAFFLNNYGLNIKDPMVHSLSETELDSFLAGSPERADFVRGEWAYLIGVFYNLSKPRLKALTVHLLESYEARWKRAAAAKTYHHARRGGLIEHTAQMLRCAQALAPLYHEVSPDLLYAGVLFHDMGKLWQNDCPEGFEIKLHRKGELLGHIMIGVEMVNAAWRKLASEKPDVFASDHEVPNELLIDHLLHLILSHHGTHEFGSPVTPRTPEAWLLHHIGNIDAKMEMLRCTYREKPLIAPGFYDKKPPLEGFAAEPIRLKPPVPEENPNHE